MTKSPRSWLIVSFMLFSLGSVSDAAKPKSSGSSWTEHCEEVREFQKDLYVDLLRKKGKPSNLWVSDAVKFLTAEANVVEIEGSVVKDDRVVAANLLYGRGCRDPIFLLRLATIQQKLDKSAEAAKTLELGLTALPKTNYPGLIRLLILGKLAKLHAKIDGGKRQKEFVDQIPDALVSSLKDGYIVRDNAELILLSLGDATTALSQPDLVAITEKCLSLEGADEWTVRVLAGQARVVQALSLLRPGADMKVPDEAKEAAKVHWSAARKVLTDAYEMEKSYASAAAAMIMVAAGDPLPDESPRTWFDRAVAARYNLADPYLYQCIAVGPVFGGNTDAILAFGMECAKSNRFDTQKPLMLMIALKQVVQLSGGSLEVFSRPGVFAEYRRVVEEREKYMKKKGDDSSFLRLFYTDLICVACKAGLKNEADELLKEHSEDLAPVVLAAYGETEASLANYVRPAKQAAESSPMASKEPDRSPAGSRPAGDGKGLEVSRWKIIAGDFEYDRNQNVVAHTSAVGAVAYLPESPGPRFEVEATIDDMNPSGDNIKRAAIFLGDPGSGGKSYLAIDWQPGNYMIVMRYNSGTGDLFYRRAGGNTGRKPGRLKVRVWDSWVYVYVDDYFLSAKKVGDFPLSAPMVGVGVFSTRPGAWATFSAVKVTTLTSEPSQDGIRFHRMVDAAYALGSQGKPQEAAKVFADASNFSSGYIAEMCSFIPRSFENRQKAKEGEAIDVLAFGKGVGNWRGELNQWETLSDGFATRSVKGFNRRELALDLTDYELTGTIEWQPEFADNLWIEMQVGNRNARHFGAILYRPNIGLYFSAHKPAVAEAKQVRPAGNEKSVTVTIRKQGDKFTVLENGKTVGTATISEIEHPLHGNIALQVYAGNPSGRVKYSNLKLTPLPSK